MVCGRPGSLKSMAEIGEKSKKNFLFSIDKGQNACYNVTDKRVDRIFQIEKC